MDSVFSFICIVINISICICFICMSHSHISSRQDICGSKQNVGKSGADAICCCCRLMDRQRLTPLWPRRPLRQGWCQAKVYRVLLAPAVVLHCWIGGVQEKLLRSHNVALGDKSLHRNRKHKHTHMWAAWEDDGSFSTKSQALRISSYARRSTSN